MPFKLNEAPNIVLSALCRHETNRCCGRFWTVLCFLPTCGMNSGCCYNEYNDCVCFKSKSDWVCCWPIGVSNKSDAALQALKHTLKTLLIRVPNSGVKPERKMIETQVSDTIKVLDQAIKDGLIEKGYFRTVKTCRETIYTRALEEEKLSKHLTEPNVITGGEPLYVAKYGLTQEEKKKPKSEKKDKPNKISS